LLERSDFGADYSKQVENQKKVSEDLGQHVASLRGETCHGEYRKDGKDGAPCHGETIKSMTIAT
jgi:hypothetical protein